MSRPSWRWSQQQPQLNRRTPRSLVRQTALSPSVPRSLRTPQVRIPGSGRKTLAAPAIPSSRAVGHVGGQPAATGLRNEVRRRKLRTGKAFPAHAPRANLRRAGPEHCATALKPHWYLSKSFEIARSARRGVALRNACVLLLHQSGLPTDCGYQRTQPDPFFRQDRFLPDSSNFCLGAATSVGCTYTQGAMHLVGQVAFSQNGHSRLFIMLSMHSIRKSQQSRKRRSAEKQVRLKTRVVARRFPYWPLGSRVKDREAKSQMRLRD